MYHSAAFIANLYNKHLALSITYSQLGPVHPVLTQLYFFYTITSVRRIGGFVYVALVRKKITSTWLYLYSFDRYSCSHLVSSAATRNEK